MKKPNRLLLELDYGNLLPVFDGFGERVIIDRNDHRSRRQNFK
jgi:hypothetical protein